MHIEFDAKITMFELSVYAEEPYSVIATEKSPDLENLIGLAKYIVEKYTQLQTLERTVPESLDMTKRAFEQQVN